MKKRTIANLIMTAIIVVIVTAGILGVGYIRGWFDRTGDTQALLTNVQGTVNMQRDGIIYPVENDMILRAGDKLLCNPGATANIQISKSSLTIGQNAELEISDPSVEGFSAGVTAGEVFANTANTVTLSFAEKEVALTEATVLVSVRSGAQSISVFAGTVEDAAAGQQIGWVGDKRSVSVLSIESLNDFTINQIRTANKTQTLCFSNEDLDQLASDRQAAIQELMNNANKSESAAPLTTTSPETEVTASTAAETEAPATDPVTVPSTETTMAAASTEATTAAASTEVTTAAPTEAPSTTATTEAPSTAAPTEAPSTAAPTEVPSTAAPTEAPSTAAPTEASSTAAPTEAPSTAAPTKAPSTAAPTEAPSTEAPTEAPTKAPSTAAPTEAPTEPPTTEAPAPAKSTCTITIRCDTILSNMGDLDPGKVEFVPGDGVILAPVTVEFDQGETVFDVLQRVCSTAGIQLEYSWTPMYNSYYIEGINQLYEFDCGSESGWMYKVNGWFPNYGCSSYTLADGDTIEWHYTCKGLGTDVGAPAW